MSNHDAWVGQGVRACEWVYEEGVRVVMAGPGSLVLIRLRVLGMLKGRFMVRSKGVAKVMNTNRW